MRRQLSGEEWARRASERFDFQVRGNTRRHTMRRGDTELQRPGPTCTIGDDAFSTIQHAVLSKICLAQMNSDADLKENDCASSRQRTLFALNYQEKCKSNCGLKCGQLR
jgi:hypothetical protein